MSEPAIEKGSIEHFLAVFTQNAEEILNSLHEQALLLESSPGDFECIDSAFRSFHTLKGNASFLGLTSVKEIAHCMENLLSLARSESRQVDKQFLDLLWEGIGHLGRSLAQVKAGFLYGRPEADAAGFIARIKELAEQEPKEQSARRVRDGDRKRYFAGEAEVSRDVYIIQAFLERDAESPGLSGDRVESFQAACGRIAGALQSAGKGETGQPMQEGVADYPLLCDDSGRPGPFLLARLRESFEAVMAALRVEECKPPAQSPAAQEPSYRIEEEKITSLSRYVSKLDKLNQDLTSMRGRFYEEGVPADLRKEMTESISALNSICQDIFQMVVKIKLVSPAQFLDKSQRMVLGLAASCGKKVKISAECGNLLVERKNLELLESVFVHLVRNCVDHGIESPAERTAAGKPETGSVTVRMKDEDNSLIVSIEDDGKGIDFAALRESARAAGKISGEECAAMGDQETVKLLFLAGISTSRSVSEISGRGVGLDAVWNVVDRAKGTISVRSTPGKGTEFVLRLPSTLNLQEG